MTQSNQLDLISEIQKLSERASNSSNISELHLFSGNLQILADKDNHLKNFLNGFSILLDNYLSSLIYDTQPQLCQSCGSDRLVRNGSYTKVINDLIGAYQIRIQRYLCKSCKKTTSIDASSMDELTYRFSGTAISISKLAAVLYNGGCSLRYTSDVILASTGISMNKDTVRSHLIKFGERIREEYANDLDRKKAKQIAFDEQYITIRTKDPNEQSTMIITVIDVEKNKIVQMRTEKAKAITELDVKLVLDEFDEVPEVIITDGSKAIASGIKEFAPDAHHERCLQHIARNVRKKKEVKKAIAETAERIVTEESNSQRKELQNTYKREVVRTLTDLLRSKTIDKKTAWQELALANEAIEERMEEMGYTEDNLKVRRKIHEAFIHRRLYSGIEAAEYARLKSQNLHEKVKQRTTGKVEGYHRPVRSRERRALCFRTHEFVRAISIINAEFYNFKRNHGIKDTPFAGFRISSQNFEEEVVERDITFRSEKYKQQRTHSIAFPGGIHTLTNVMQSIA
ncbi:MAG: ISL3 family transposase, partial [Candidatus Heimdallarchaeota archaeon]|nr:ISL3 family transposase [Candidatus Heimdallarchaeota archaeon]